MCRVRSQDYTAGSEKHEIGRRSGHVFLSSDHTSLMAVNRVNRKKERKKNIHFALLCTIVA